MAIRVSLLPSPSLLPNSNLFYWDDRIIHLPKNAANTSNEFKQGFIKALKSVEEFSMKKLSPEEKKIARKKAWEEIRKVMPETDNTRTIILVIEMATVAFLLIIGSRACL